MSGAQLDHVLRLLALWGVAGFPATHGGETYVWGAVVHRVLPLHLLQFLGYLTLALLESLLLAGDGLSLEDFLFL